MTSFPRSGSNPASAPREQGLSANLPQFLLLVLINAFVGGMVGIERSILPALAEVEFSLTARSAVFSFIAVFGVTKAVSNYTAGRLGDRWGRKPVLVLGWVFAAPVPFLLMWAPTWDWVIVANVFLGISQGLTWSTAVIMKIDLAGPRNRGLAMGLNEFAGYAAVAATAWLTGWLAVRYGLRPEPFYLGVGFVVLGLALSILLVRETIDLARCEEVKGLPDEAPPSQTEIFLQTSWKDRNLSAATQAGLVNNLNDGMAWGLFPLVFAAAGLGLAQIGTLAAIYPGVWGLSQLVTGGLSDRWGRKWFIAGGMGLQALGIALTALGSGFADYAIAAVLLGFGTAMVYPTLLAAISDVAPPPWRGSAIGTYRLWRDLGYAFGAVIAGVIADLYGLDAAVWTIAALTLGSGVLVGVRMTETRPL